MGNPVLLWVDNDTLQLPTVHHPTNRQAANDSLSADLDFGRFWFNPVTLDHKMNPYISFHGQSM